MQSYFKGIMPALITPLDGNGKVNEESTRGLIEHLLSQGADGFYVVGSTGEGIVLPEEERKKLLEISVSQVAGRKPVICHVASMNFEEGVRLAKHADKAGADAISAIPPLFFHYGDGDIYNYYKTLAGSADLPFIMYNHSAANGGLSAEAVTKMFKEIDNITGVKWTVNNYYELMRLKDMTNGDINVINGPDEMLVCGLSAGADAGIGSTYNVMLPWFVELYKEFKNGNISKAREIQYKINRVITCMIKFELIPGLKQMCTMMGFDAGEGCYPFKQSTPEYTAEFTKALAEAGWNAKDFAN